MERQQLLKSHPSLPTVQQASHFHPCQPALAYHQIRLFVMKRYPLNQASIFWLYCPREVRETHTRYTSSQIIRLIWEKMTKNIIIIDAS